jgi:hypothetical protein
MGRVSEPVALFTALPRLLTMVESWNMSRDATKVPGTRDETLKVFPGSRTGGVEIPVQVCGGRNKDVPANRRPDIDNFWGDKLRPEVVTPGVRDF